MKQKFYLVLLCSILFFSCKQKFYIYLINKTSKEIYFNVGNMGVRNPILKPDSSVLIGGGLLNSKKRIEVFGPHSLLISSCNDTIILEGDHFKQIIDSLWVKDRGGINLEIMETWFQR